MPLPDTLTCSNCGTAITVDQSNSFDVEGFDMYQCYQCRDYLGLNYGGQLYEPDELWDDDWIHDGSSPPESTVGDAAIHRVNTTKEKIAVQLLNVEAKEEESSFMSYVSEDIEALLLVQSGRAAGYLVWGRNQGDPEIRQIFVLPSHRRQGLATSMVETFIDIHNNSYFCVESPGTETLLLLDNLGYIDHTEDSPFLDGCAWTGNSITPPKEWYQSE